jgi:hypothetical protein
MARYPSLTLYLIGGPIIFLLLYPACGIAEPPTG